MRLSKPTHLALAAIVLFTATVWTACDNAKTPTSSPSATADGKVPITTKSEDARKEYLQGRDLAEKLLGQESLQHFDKAIALDPDFATAELARANNSPTTKEFFEHLNKAVSLADKASDGEKTSILATQAGTNGNVAKQKEDLDKPWPAIQTMNGHNSIWAIYFGQQEYSRSRALQESHGIAPNYLARLQHSRVRLPAAG